MSNKKHIGLIIFGFIFAGWIVFLFLSSNLTFKIILGGVLTIALYKVRQEIKALWIGQQFVMRKPIITNKNTKES